MTQNDITDTYKDELSKLTKERDKLSQECRKLKLAIEKSNELYQSNLQSSAYKLGHLLLHETRSFSSVIQLPVKVFYIWKEGRTNQKNRKKPLTKVDYTNLNKTKSNPKTKTIENLKELKIACIMDTFSFNVFEPEVELHQITPESWKNELEIMQPDMLFVESAWRGKDDLWQMKIVEMSQELIDILTYCRQHNIVTVFWNKEDPFHFDDFINTAQYFDVIFTTDMDSVTKYKSKLAHSNIFLLPFASQPKIHNPIEKYDRKNKFVFAGAYYPHFPKRMKLFEDFIEHLSVIGELDIFDRHFGNINTSNKFPEKYHSLIRGSLAYHEIDKAYKGYKYAINLNSITDSKTMFSRRVFELIASNTLVLSNYAIGISYLFGDLIINAKSGKELTKKFLDFTKDPIYEKKVRLLALRKVMSEHTAQSRLNLLVSKVYKQPFIELSLPYITMISYINSIEDFNNVYAIFKKQTYKHKYLTIIHSKDIDILPITSKDIQFIPETESKTLSEIKNLSEYIAGVVSHDYYGKNYLLDLALATSYSEVPIIGKKAHYTLNVTNGLILENHTSSYHIVQSIPARSSIIKKEQIQSSKIVTWAKNIFSETYHDTILSIDEYNYCKNEKNATLTEEQLILINDLEDIYTGVKFSSIL